MLDRREAALMAARLVTLGLLVCAVVTQGTFSLVCYVSAIVAVIAMIAERLYRRRGRTSQARKNGRKRRE